MRLWNSLNCTSTSHGCWTLTDEQCGDNQVGKRFPLRNSETCDRRKLQPWSLKPLEAKPPHLLLRLGGVDESGMLVSVPKNAAIQWALTSLWSLSPLSLATSGAVRAEGVQLVKVLGSRWVKINPPILIPHMHFWLFAVYCQAKSWVMGNFATFLFGDQCVEQAARSNRKQMESRVGKPTAQKVTVTLPSSFHDPTIMLNIRWCLQTDSCLWFCPNLSAVLFKGQHTFPI